MCSLFFYSVISSNDLRVLRVKGAGFNHRLFTGVRRSRGKIEAAVAANKNNGDTFLLIWRISDVEEASFGSLYDNLMVKDY